MKRPIIVSLVAVCSFCLMGTSAQVTEQDPEAFPEIPPFESQIIRTVNISHPIVAKVFPGVEFQEQTSDVTAPPRKRIVAFYGGRIFGMTSHFNSLFEVVPHANSVNVEEQLEA